MCRVTLVRCPRCKCNFRDAEFCSAGSTENVPARCRATNEFISVLLGNGKCKPCRQIEAEEDRKWREENGRRLYDTWLRDIGDFEAKYGGFWDANGQPTKIRPGSIDGRDPATRGEFVHGNPVEATPGGNRLGVTTTGEQAPENLFDSWLKDIDKFEERHTTEDILCEATSSKDLIELAKEVKRAETWIQNAETFVSMEVYQLKPLTRRRAWARMLPPQDDL